MNKKQATDALFVQDACNLSGVVYAFARVMDDICVESREEGKGTEWRNSHPICVLFASKIAELTKCEDLNVFGRAYLQAKEASDEE